MQKKGKVYLLGAGPGDIGLLTKKGWEILQKAQVVVYDSLVSDEILANIPNESVKINVGKRASNHTLPQEEINKLLVSEAKAGREVVRLKGGDPFLFGRGGEEIELLLENDIPYEVIPGVTSALSVPAYNGIPVTHRDFVSSVHIITGHKRQGADYDIDFEALVRTGGTLVFLMGVSSAMKLMEGLIKAGMDPDMPAAYLEQGTNAGQRRIVATVGTLKRQMVDINPPGIIVVGQVCSLSEKFAWWEKLPLSGKKIILTRPKALISKMAKHLRNLGAQVIEMPTVEITRISDNNRLYKAFDELDKYGWVVFTSPTGVEIFFEEMQERHVDVRRLASVKFAVLGSGTDLELRKHGFYSDLMPDKYDGKSLGKALAKAASQKERILIPRAKIGNPEIIEELSEFEVEDIPTYDTLYIKNEILDLQKDIEAGGIYCAAFTSSSIVRSFVSAYPELNFEKLKAACIGEKTAQAAREANMQVFVAEESSIDSLIELIEDGLQPVQHNRRNW